MIEKNKFYRITINFFVGIISLSMYWTVENQGKLFLILSALSIVTMVVIIRTCKEPLSSPYTLFVIVMFIYNCGQVWLNLFGVPILSGNYTITRYSDDLLSSSILFFILSLLAINIFFISKTKNVFDTDDSFSNATINDDYHGGNNVLVLFFVVFIVCLIYDFGQYRIASSSGYAAALYARSNNELLYMFNCAFPFVVFWILRLAINKKIKRLVFILSAVRYAATTILIGYRMQAISFVLALIVLVYGIVEEKNKKKITALMIFGLVAAGFLSIISANIRRGNVSVGIWDSYNSLIQELGGTFTDLPIIIRDIDEIGAVYGLSYICAALYMIPLIGHVIPGMSKYVNLSSILYTRITIYGNSSLGGSMLAEFFYNFKWASIFILAPIVGWIFAKICNSINNRNSSAFETAMLSYIFYIFLLFSRGNIGEVTIYIRCAVYICVLHHLLRVKIA